MNAGRTTLAVGPGLLGLLLVASVLAAVATTPPVGQRTVLAVGTAPITVGIDVSPTQGGVPLTVNLTAVASGGSGNYTEFAWNMGDGGSGVGRTIEYTFVRPGTFVVTVTVTDSSDDRGSAEVGIAVDPVDSAGGPTPAPLWLEGSLVTAGLAAGIVAGVLLWRYRTVSRSAFTSPPTIFQVPVSPGSDGGAAPPAAPASAADVTSEPGPRSRAPVEAPTLRLSERLILYLAGLPGLSADDIGTVERTQSHLVERLEASQSAVSNVLVRLAAAGVVTGRTRHVSGLSRRVKVYELTPYGDRLARELRGRRAAGSGPGTGSAAEFPAR